MKRNIEAELKNAELSRAAVLDGARIITDAGNTLDDQCIKIIRESCQKVIDLQNELERVA